ncbi:MAG TPA: hypothetical protein PLO65_08460 [Caulobacter sp.]|nr:hypothetical protein [Caulobacter sp.]
MKFTLTYDGELPSGGNGSKVAKKAKWAIREQFHPQLVELWGLNPALKRLPLHSIVPKSGTFPWVEGHHFGEEGVLPPDFKMADDEIDLCALIERGADKYKPIVRNSYALTCSLNILFLRKEAAGRVYQGGDLDNRIKTLLDALSVPHIYHPRPPHLAGVDPMHCLLEDDALVTGLNVKSERLLSRPGTSENEVHLVVEVDVRVSDTRNYNAMFLGD